MTGPPYPSTSAGVGGLPTINEDVSITAIFLAIYLSFAAANMAILQLNNRKGHKFLFSGMIFGFCMARTVTCIMRIVWANRQHNVRVAIAANIFYNAGVLIVYLVNLVFAQRVFRAMHKRVGWNTVFSWTFKALYACIVALLILVVTTVILQFYTLDHHIREICLYCQRGASIFLLAIACAPLFILFIGFVLPRDKDAEESFGHGILEHKAILLSLATILATIIAGFRAGTSWEPPRPVTDPAWYDSKASFYNFGFVLEVLILTLFVFGRVDKRFHVPNGSSKRKTYMAQAEDTLEKRESLESV